MVTILVALNFISTRKFGALRGALPDMISSIEYQTSFVIFNTTLQQPKVVCQYKLGNCITTR
jgi:hypothetical protein